MASSMVHMNGDLLVAMDFSTTGTDPDQHDIWQLVAVVLNAKLNREPEYRSFVAEYIQPRGPAMGDRDVSGNKIHGLVYGNQEYARKAGVCQEDVVYSFIRWFDSMVPAGKQFQLLLANNSNNRLEFLRNMFGERDFNMIFSTKVRDLQSTALFLNDVCFFTDIDHPFARMKLENISSYLNLNVEDLNDTASCLVRVQFLIDCYKKMVYNARWNPVSSLYELRKEQQEYLDAWE